MKNAIYVVVYRNDFISDVFRPLSGRWFSEIDEFKVFFFLCDSTEAHCEFIFAWMCSRRRLADYIV